MALYTALRERGHTVHVVAPMEQQSGVGHSLTVFEPLRCLHFKQPGFEGLGLYGTPTDCVKLALASLLEKRPDLVMSGINAGPNVGPDILYSGTVGAATEACHEDLPSMAISDDEQDPIGLLSSSKGVRVCKQTSAVWKNSYLERRDPRGGRYWWLVGSIPPETVNSGSDKDLLNRGFVTITPLCFNFTDDAGLRILERESFPNVR